jgi:hypothetical protein
LVKPWGKLSKPWGKSCARLDQLIHEVTLQRRTRFGIFWAMDGSGVLILDLNMEIICYRCISHLIGNRVNNPPRKEVASFFLKLLPCNLDWPWPFEVNLDIHAQQSYLLSHEPSLSLFSRTHVLHFGESIRLPGCSPPVGPCRCLRPIRDTIETTGI